MIKDKANHVKIILTVAVSEQEQPAEEEEAPKETAPTIEDQLSLVSCTSLNNRKLDLN